VSGAGALARTLIDERENALLFKKLATLRTDIPLFENVDELEWHGPRPEFEEIGRRLDASKREGSSTSR
jgi:hypothetical protein